MTSSVSRPLNMFSDFIAPLVDNSEACEA
jgi:hypothetical protein